MKPNILNLKGINKSYDQNHVLRDLDFTVPEGTVMGLVGKNGAGKSTMIKCLLGLVKPDSGDASIYDDNAWNLSDKTRQRIGYVPQSITGFQWMTVEGMLNYVGAFYPKWDEKKIKHLLKEWDLDAYARVGNLSEGQRQKLAIIQVMGHDPDVFIFDEPVAALDPVARRKFIKQLVDINMNENKTVLFSTHITSDLERVSADIAILSDGAIRYKGDLAVLKEKVRRLHIQAQKPLPEPLPLPNILYCDRDEAGTWARVTVEGIDEGDIAKLEKNYAASIDSEFLNLEDIFLEMNR